MAETIIVRKWNLLELFPLFFLLLVISITTIGGYTGWFHPTPECTDDFWGCAQMPVEAKTWVVGVFCGIAMSLIIASLVRGNFYERIELCKQTKKVS